MTTWRIKKTADSLYRVTGRTIDEDVNDVQLMGMLSSKGISESGVRDLLWSLDQKEIGYEQTLTFKD
jgi:hypothetical protein